MATPLLPQPSAGRVAVCIPVYKREPEKDEELTLRRCARVMGRHPIVFFAPETLELSPYRQWIPTAGEERFAPEYFDGISGYNRLLLSREFYDRFRNFEYILIHQLDAWTFRDELEAWCAREFDFIGAPFASPLPCGPRLLPGNGGFSLRRVEAFRRLLTPGAGFMFRPEYSALLLACQLRQRRAVGTAVGALRLVGIGNSRRFRMRIVADGSRNEDMVFWEFSRRNSYGGLRMASVKDAWRFSWNSGYEPRRAAVMPLPFGCHGWNKKCREAAFLRRKVLETIG